MSNAHRSFSSFFWFQPQKYQYLVIDLNFYIHLGIHLSKPGDKLVYCYLYNEEASFTIYLFSHLLNRPFIIFIQTQYLSIWF